jgi:hypothetical protein
MKVCPNCRSKYPDDANFCPQESCATPQGPCRLLPVTETGAAGGRSTATREPEPAKEAQPRYELAALLGGGGSGEVWQAHDGQTAETVAYKLVAPASLPTPAAVDRALRELKQLQRAQSPRIARVIDFGKNGDGRLFVVMELVSGRPLDDVVHDGGPFALDRAKRIVAQIGEALLEAQKVGVVHHDLSAKNVLVAAGDEVKLINFVAPRPVTESVFGVPEYLTPEQAEGKLVDQRSNTYSLGALLMLLLTGEPPVSGADASAVLDQVLRGEIAPPSRRRPGLGPDIDRVVMKAMEKSSSRRPLTMRQFLNDVAALTGALTASTGAGVGAAAPAAAAIPAASGAGAMSFAKTMVFAGGAPEVPRLATQAAAARAEANGAQVAAASFTPSSLTAAGMGEKLTPPPAVPAAAPPAAVPVAAAALKRTHGAAIAPTMMAAPSANPALMPSAAAARMPASMPPTLDPALMQPTPPPVRIAPAAAAMSAAAVSAAASTGAPAQKGSGAGSGNFRETLWFKKGDVDQMVADAKAKVVASRKGAGSVDPELPLEEDGKPLEDRYVDDGSVTVEDRKKFSLRSGGTSAALPTVGGVVPGERMSEAEMLSEIGGGKRIGIMVVGALVVVAIVTGLVFAFRGKNVAQSAAALAPHATETAPGGIVAPVPPTALPPPAAAPPSPTAAAAVEAAPRAATKASHPGGRKHAAKKHAGAKRRR